jgi:hypothetical protein
MSVSVRLDNVIITYPHLFEKHAAPGSTTEKYSAEFILDPTKNKAAIDKVQAGVLEVAREAGKADKIKTFKFPVLRSGDAENAERERMDRSPRPELAGKVFIRASDPNFQPQIVDRNRQPIGESQRSMIFGGCVVNAFIDFYYSAGGANPGVFVGLKGVQLVDNVNVEKLGGGAPSAEAMFDVVDGPAPLVGEATEQPGWM